MATVVDAWHLELAPFLAAPDLKEVRYRLENPQLALGYKLYAIRECHRFLFDEIHERAPIDERIRVLLDVAAGNDVPAEVRVALIEIVANLMQASRIDAELPRLFSALEAIWRGLTDKGKYVGVLLTPYLVGAPVDSDALEPGLRDKMNSLCGELLDEAIAVSRRAHAAITVELCNSAFWLAWRESRRRWAQATSLYSQSEIPALREVAVAIWAPHDLANGRNMDADKRAAQLESIDVLKRLLLTEQTQDLRDTIAMMLLEYATRGALRTHVEGVLRRALEMNLLGSIAAEMLEKELGK